MTNEKVTELERRGYHVTSFGCIQVGSWLIDPTMAESVALVRQIAEVAAVLGITPAGFAVTPRTQEDDGDE